MSGFMRKEGSDRYGGGQVKRTEIPGSVVRSTEKRETGEEWKTDQEEWRKGSYLCESVTFLAANNEIITKLVDGLRIFDDCELIPWYRLGAPDSCGEMGWMLAKSLQRPEVSSGQGTPYFLSYSGSSSHD